MFQSWLTELIAKGVAWFVVACCVLWGLGWCVNQLWLRFTRTHRPANTKEKP